MRVETFARTNGLVKYRALGSKILQVKGHVGRWKEKGVTSWIPLSDLEKGGLSGRTRDRELLFDIEVLGFFHFD